MAKESWNFNIYEIPHSYNLGQNICRLFHFLAQFLSTTSETELDYYHHTVCENPYKFTYQY